MQAASASEAPGSAAPEQVSCIAKGKSRQPYEFGAKASIAIKHKQGLIVGARSFPGNPYDGHTLLSKLSNPRTGSKIWTSSPPPPGRCEPRGGRRPPSRE